MSTVEVRDHALWAKHIHGNERLKGRIVDLSEGSRIDLVVDGKPGTWVKMDNGKDGRPTHGLKAIGPTREIWHGMQDQRGTFVSIEEG